MLSRFPGAPPNPAHATAKDDQPELARRGGGSSDQPLQKYCATARAGLRQGLGLVALLAKKQSACFVNMSVSLRGGSQRARFGWIAASTRARLVRRCLRIDKPGAGLRGRAIR